jgi:hypothetical protein
MIKQTQTPKQRKVEQILSLIAGTINPTDIGPSLVINFNTQQGDIYLINGNLSTKIEFDNLLATLPSPFPERFKCTGRPGDDGPTPDEYYYGEMPL